MAGRRPKKTTPNDQVELDLWGLAEEAADARVADAREAAPSSTETALVGGQLSFDDFFNQ